MADITTTPIPTTLTKELKEKIKSVMLEFTLDAENDKELIAEKIGLTPEILKELFIKDRQERLIKKAEQTAESLLDLDLDSNDTILKFGKTKIELLKAKLREAEFIRSTLGKDMGYSSRNEVTGKNGEEIRIKEIIFNAPIAVKPDKDK